MTTVPRSTDTVAVLKVLNAFADFDYVANDLMAGHTGEDIAHVTGAESYVGEADAAGEDLGEDLAFGGVFEGDIAESP
jgi:hypothetical protein